MFAFEGVSPQVDPTAWIAPTATLIGDVTVEAEASVWYGAVLRADFGPIVIRAGANIQDNTVIHTGSEATIIGIDATVGHMCVVHACVVEDQALIGNGATVQDGARIGKRTLVAAGSTVPPNAVIPPEVVVVGTPARERGPLSESAAVWVDNNGPVYRDLARRHAEGISPAD